jgi:predicted transcriptional regulator
MVKMGQEEILKFLKKNEGKKYTINQLSEFFQNTKTSIQKNVVKLEEFNFIKIDNVCLGRTQHYSKVAWYEKNIKK